MWKTFVPRLFEEFNKKLKEKISICITISRLTTRFLLFLSEDFMLRIPIESAMHVQKARAQHVKSNVMWLILKWSELQKLKLHLLTVG